MQKPKLLLASLLLLIALVIGIFPAASLAQQGSSEANFVFINYIGQEVTLDLDDTTYMVPGTATNPEGGRLALSLGTGEHKYAVNAAGVPTGDRGTFIIEPGQVVGKAARLEQTGPTLDRDGNVLQKPEEYVLVFDVNPLATPAAASAPAVDAWQPAPAVAGMASLAWINYTGDELTVDMNGQLYKVPPQAGSIPGRLQTSVTPGLYRFTASIPNGSVNGEVVVSAGQVVGLSVSAEFLPTPEYDIGEPVPSQEVRMRLTQEDLTASASALMATTGTVTTTAVTTATTPTTATVASPAPAATGTPVAAEGTPAAPRGLLIRNFTGDTVVFTIADREYFIPAGAEETIQLAPGQYNYTASLPYVASTGTVSLAADQGVTLSLATSASRDVMNVYES